jgi:uncharacterized protein (DUF1800 family)
MINTQRPLEEKMTLFWHQVFATAVSKVDHYDEITRMIAMFRSRGMGSYKELLVAVAQNPAMIYWLDNCENRTESVNENWGRELLELFSLGVGNYTEVDVREASRAFTGWTIEPKLPRGPIGRHDWRFTYRSEAHDNGEKTFLGKTGNFNGEDVIDIICAHPATAIFIARHLYNFFVADEPPVSTWSFAPPGNPKAIGTLAKAFRDAKGDIRSVLRVLFLSDFFKNARFTKVKSPVELVVSTLKMVGGHEFPAPGIEQLSRQLSYMGQDLLNPPSVKGWPTGWEWINSGTLMRRINFTAEMVGDVNRPGVQSIVGRIKAQGDLSPEGFVDTCLDLMGPLEVDQETRQELINHASVRGLLVWSTEQDAKAATERICELLQLIVSLRNYQFA